MSNGEAFAAMDRVLDSAVVGPKYLALPEIAALVVASLRHGETVCRHYTLHSFVVMPNHVHVLVTSLVEARRWVGSLKGATGRISSWEPVASLSGRMNATTT
jgi:hypothetical protein